MGKVVRGIHIYVSTVRWRGCHRVEWSESRPSTRRKNVEVPHVSDSWWRLQYLVTSSLTEFDTPILKLRHSSYHSALMLEPASPEPINIGNVAGEDVATSITCYSPLGCASSRKYNNTVTMK